MSKPQHNNTMHSPLWPLIASFSWQELRQHPWRNAAAVVSVMLGVALAFSVHVINASALDEFAQAVREREGFYTSVGIHSVPAIIDAARVNLAAAWLMLVVAELLAAEQGLAWVPVVLTAPPDDEGRLILRPRPEALAARHLDVPVAPAVRDVTVVAAE